MKEDEQQIPAFGRRSTYGWWVKEEKKTRRLRSRIIADVDVNYF